MTLPLLCARALGRRAAASRPALPARRGPPGARARRRRGRDAAGPAGQSVVAVLLLANGPGTHRPPSTSSSTPRRSTCCRTRCSWFRWPPAPSRAWPASAATGDAEGLRRHRRPAPRARSCWPPRPARPCWWRSPSRSARFFGCLDPGDVSAMAPARGGDGARPGRLRAHRPRRTRAVRPRARSGRPRPRPRPAGLAVVVAMTAAGRAGAHERTPGGGARRGQQHRHGGGRRRACCVALRRVAGPAALDGLARTPPGTGGAALLAGAAGWWAGDRCAPRPGVTACSASCWPEPPRRSSHSWCSAGGAGRARPSDARGGDPTAAASVQSQGSRGRHVGAGDAVMKVLLVQGTSAGGVGRHVAALASGLVARAATTSWSAGPSEALGRLRPRRAPARASRRSRSATARPARATVRRRRSCAASAVQADVVHAHGLRAGGPRGAGARVALAPQSHTRWSSRCTTCRSAGGGCSGSAPFLERLVAAGRAAAVLGVSRRPGRADGRARRRPGRAGAGPVAARCAAGRHARRGAREGAGRAGAVRPPTAADRDGGAAGAAEGLPALVRRRSGGSRGRARRPRRAGRRRRRRPAARRDRAACPPPRTCPCGCWATGPTWPTCSTAADVAVSTSVWEGQPLNVQEALRHGAPLVATDVGRHRRGRRRRRRAGAVRRRGGARCRRRRPARRPPGGPRAPPRPGWPGRRPSRPTTTPWQQVLGLLRRGGRRSLNRVTERLRRGPCARVRRGRSRGGAGAAIVEARGRADTRIPSRPGKAGPQRPATSSSPVGWPPPWARA